MIYIFGYGSLIFDKGINNRGMKHEYNNSELQEATLFDYLREWNAVWQGLQFLGLKYQKGAITNGVVFKISEEDLEPFKKSECVPICYQLKDVTNLVPMKLNSDDVVYTCVTNNPEYNGYIPSYYLNTLNDGLRIRSKNFQEQFYKQHKNVLIQGLVKSERRP